MKKHRTPIDKMITKQLYDSIEKSYASTNNYYFYDTIKWKNCPWITNRKTLLNNIVRPFIRFSCSYCCCWCQVSKWLDFPVYSTFVAWPLFLFKWNRNEKSLIIYGEMVIMDFYAIKNLNGTFLFIETYFKYGTNLIKWL